MASSSNLMMLSMWICWLATRRAEKVLVLKVMLVPSTSMASGASILTTSYASPDREPVLPQLAAFAQESNSSSAIVFSAILNRMALFSEARFTFQAKDDKHLFGTTALAKLETPFGPNSTTGHLLARMEQDAFLAGQAYIWDPPGEDRLIRLRPDWVTIVSARVQMDTGWYRRKIGYWFEEPKSLMERSDGFMVPAEECVHWAPQPDPAADFRGMSWLTPIWRDVAGDSGMASYKIKYLENAASPNMLIKYAQKLQPGSVDRIRERVTARYAGADNAFKTLILDQGADATVIGQGLGQMDFGTVSSVGVERILAAANVPGVLVGLEPLRGAGRGYQESMQKFGNLFARPKWRSVCGALSQIVDVPGGNRLWFDTADIAALQDGEMERGQAALVRAQALLALVQAGYTHESAIAAVDAMDLSQLKAGGIGTPTSGPQVQHMLGQAQPGATATPLPATLPRLPTGPASVGDGGDGSRPTPRPASARRALTGANGHG
jgi:phage portal protein BeeE